MTESRPVEFFGITELEDKMLEALVAASDYESAADELGVSVSSVKGTTYRLRLRYAKAREFVKLYRRLHRKLGPNGRYLPL